MIVIAGLAHLQPGHEEAVKALVAAVVEPTRKEAGCISYDMYPTGPNGLFVFEQWDTAAALEAHLATPHVTTFLQAMGAHLAAPPALTRYEVTKHGPLF